MVQPTSNRRPPPARLILLLGTATVLFQGLLISAAAPDRTVATFGNVAVENVQEQKQQQHGIGEQNGAKDKEGKKEKKGKKNVKKQQQQQQQQQQVDGYLSDLWKGIVDLGKDPKVKAGIAALKNGIHASNNRQQR
ncbi:hypothetical protein BGZ58_006540, partial [Dissophora ornata]